MSKETEKYKEIINSLDKNDERYIDKLLIVIKQILLERNTFVQSSSNDNEREEFYRFLKEELLKYDKKDIEFIASGHSSLTFRINDKVLKVGKSKIDEKKYRKKFPCLIPLFVDECLKIDAQEYYTLQVSPYVDTLDIDKEDVYSTYKRLRDLGYIWNDPTLDNTGRMISDLEYNGIKYKKGDLVIIDLEDLAYVGLEETPDYILEEISVSSYNRDVYNFEMRYIEEKRKGINK